MFHRFSILALAPLVLLLFADAPTGQGALIENAYAVTELAVTTDQGTQWSPDVSGNAVVWADAASQQAWALDLDSGQRIALGKPFGAFPGVTLGATVRVDGSRAAYLEQDPVTFRGRIVLVDVHTSQRLPVDPPTTDVGTFDLSSEWLVYSDHREGQNGIYLLSHGGQETLLATERRSDFAGTIDGDYVAWKQALPFGQVRLFARRISTGEQWQLVDFVPSGDPPIVDAYSVPAVSSAGVVVWNHGIGSPHGSPYSQIEGAWLGGATPAPFEAWSAQIIGDVALSGSIAVFTEGQRLIGYDLKGPGFFIVSQAVGRKAQPAVSIGETSATVVWLDYRNAGLASSRENSDVFAAVLKPGPAPMPAATGVPSAVDARIQIVWPNGSSVTESSRANVGIYLFLSGSAVTAACQWEPMVRLWKAVNNGPAHLVADGRKYAGRTAAGTVVPTWVFNDVDVSEAQDPLNKVYFHVTVDDTPSTSTVWSHGEDARTYFPIQESPGEVRPLPAPRLFNGFESVIQIVWPHGGAPVDQTEAVNVSATLFYRGTRDVPPPDYNPESMVLYAALNNGALQPVANGLKRVVRDGNLEYPVWDFNDLPVPAARDPLNKYYLTARADGDHTASIWAHGADARTYFPEKDLSANNCD